jgi:dTDP-4-amino-4,6-dideoxygalactose transaminase
MEAVKAAAAARGPRVVEDACQAFCSRSADGALGTLSDAAAFSMGITKLITTGEGGFVATNDDALAGRLRKLRNHGVRRIADNRFEEMGLNFRFTDVQAAVALAQLDRLDEKIAAVRAVHAFYRERLEGLPYIRMLDCRTADGELPLWAQAVAAERDRVVALLAGRGIEARPFHPPLADSPHLKAAGDFPNARWFADHGLTLPSGTDQPREDLERTAEALWAIRGEIAGAVEPPQEPAP